MKSVTSRKIIDTLEIMFSTHEIPNSLKTDNGPQFVSDEIEKYFQDNDIEHRTSTPLWPQANGEVERQNRSLLKVMRIAQAEKKDWRRELLKFLMAYRSTPHNTTGESPAKLLYGREIRTKLPSLRSSSSRMAADEDARDKDSVAKQKGKDYADNRRNAQESGLPRGDQVLLKLNRSSKLDTPFHPEPYRVVDKRGSEVTIQSSTGERYRRNVTHVKKFHTESPQPQPTTLCQPEESVEAQGNSPKPALVLRRSQRERFVPEHLKDYELC